MIVPAFDVLFLLAFIAPPAAILGGALLLAFRPRVRRQPRRAIHPVGA